MSKNTLKSKRTRNTILGMAVAVCFVAASIFFSGMLITKALSSDKNVVMEADESYYLPSKSKLAINASMNLSYADRINLVSGSWASSCRECSLDSGFITETEAVSLAKSQMEYYYNAGVYPYSLISHYGNWYSWNARLYEYTDTTFNTYTVYLWCIDFIKYDNSLSHTVLMTENGTIINAEVHTSTDIDIPIINAYTTNTLSYTLSEIMGDSSLTLNDFDSNNDTININYPQVDAASIKNIDSFTISINQSNKAPEQFVVYQYQTDASYGIGIIPK